MTLAKALVRISWCLLWADLCSSRPVVLAHSFFFLRCKRTRSCEQAQLFCVAVQMRCRPFQFELRLLPDEWKVETLQNTRWNFQQSSTCSVRITLASKFAFSKRLAFFCLPHDEQSVPQSAWDHCCLVQRCSSGSVAISVQPLARD